LRGHAELGHQASLHVVVKEIAADAELRDLELAVTERLGRARYGVVLRMVEASSRRSKPLVPCVPMTIMSTPRSTARETICRSGCPTSTTASMSRGWLMADVANERTLSLSRWTSRSSSGAFAAIGV
jgi:hypothetical protein